MSILSVPSSVASADPSGVISSPRKKRSLPPKLPVGVAVKNDLLTTYYGSPLVHEMGLAVLRELPEIKGEAIQFTTENVPYISPEKMLSHRAVRGKYVDRHGHRFFIAYKFQAFIAGTKNIKVLNIVNLIIHKNPFLYKDVNSLDFEEFTRIQMSYNAYISAPNSSVKWNIKELGVKKGLTLFKELLTKASTEIKVNFKKASYLSHC